MGSESERRAHPRRSDFGESRALGRQPSGKTRPSMVRWILLWSSEDVFRLFDGRSCASRTRGCDRCSKIEQEMVGKVERTVLVSPDSVVSKGLLVVEKRGWRRRSQIFLLVQLAIGRDRVPVG